MQRSSQTGKEEVSQRKVIVTGIDKIWEADLVDMQAFSKDNDAVKYLLTVTANDKKRVTKTVLLKITETKLKQINSA